MDLRICIKVLIGSSVCVDILIFIFEEHIPLEEFECTELRLFNFTTSPDVHVCACDSRRNHYFVDLKDSVLDQEYAP